MKKTWRHKLCAWVLALAMVLTPINLPQNTATVKAATGLPGARSCSDSDGNVFLGGNYIEIGVSKHGSFGTSKHPADSVNNTTHTNKAFHSSTSFSGLGLQADQDGWNVGNAPTMGDFFLPGAPEERWNIAYKLDGTTYEHSIADRMSSTISGWLVEPIVQNVSSGDTLKAEVYGVTAENVAVTLTYSFEKDDMEYQTDVSIENLSDKTLSDVRFVRSFDPDQDQQLNSSFQTYNKVICNPVSSKKAGAENYAMVVARGEITLGGFFFLAVDNRARASVLTGLQPNSAYDSLLWDSAEVTAKKYADDSDIQMSTTDTNGYALADTGIALTFDLGTMYAGGSDSLTYYSSLNPNVKESLDKLKKELKLSIDCKDESIAGFDGSGIYDITQDTSDKKWKLVIDDDKTYKLYDSDETVVASGTYDEDNDLGVKFLEEWYGSTLTIQKRQTGDTKYEASKVTIPSRPETPSDPQAPNTDNSAPSEVTKSDVTTTTDSIVVRGVRGQEYTIDDGKTWKKPDGDKLVSFTDLESGKIYTVKTRVAATNSTLCSETSQGLDVKTMQMFQDVVETSYEGDFDGQYHELTAKTDVEGATVSYSTRLDGEYQNEPYSFKKGGTNETIYYKVEKSGYYTLYGKLTAVIHQSLIQVVIQDASKTYGEEDPAFEYKLLKDGKTYDSEVPGISIERKAGEDAGAYKITGTYTPDEDAAYDVQFEAATLTIKPKKIGVTWDDTALVYNGQEQMPTARVNDSDLIEGDTCNPMVEGAKKDANAAGETYTARVAKSDNPNYEVTGETAYTIAPKTVTFLWENTALTYNGKAQLPTVSISNLEEGDQCDADIAVYEPAAIQKDPVSAIDAGTYIVKVTGLDNPNYMIPEDSSILFAINPKPFRTGATVSLEDSALHYDDERNQYYYEWDGDFKEPAVKVVDKDTGVELIRDKDYTVTGDQSSDELGDHKFYLQGKGNYGTGRLDRIYMTWSIEQAEIHPQISLNDWTYGQKANTPKVSGANITGDVVYTYYTDESCQNETGTENGAQIPGGVPANAGTYYVKAVFAETDNYKEAVAMTSFTIARKAILVKPDEDQSKIYGDHDPELTYDADLVGDDTLAGSLARQDGETVGTYEITAGDLSNANYDITVQTGVRFEIKAKKLTSDMVTVDPINYPYDGNEHKPAFRYKDHGLQVKGTELTSDDVTVRGDISAADYGVYEVRMIGHGNYTGTVTKKWCVSSVQDVKVTYDGEEHSVKVLDNADGVRVRFADENGEYTLEEPLTAIEPGTYTYAYQMTIDEGEWGDPIVAEGTARLTIEKIVLKPEIILPEAIVYEDEYAPTLSGNDGNGEVTYSYKRKDDPDDAYTDEKPTDAGEYTVCAQVTETEHYTSAVVTRDFTIAKHAIDTINPTGVYYAKEDTGKKQIVLDELYKNLKGVEYRIQSTTDPSGILEADTVSVSEEGVLSYQLTGNVTQDATAEIEVRITSTNYQDVVVKMTMHIDVTAPTGEIRIAEKSWKVALNKISFGLFFKESKEVTISAEDKGIGLASIQYYVAKDAMSEEDLQALDESEWTDYEPFCITPNSSNVVYAKLMDKGGNTSIINSDGIVLYTDSAQDTDKITYTRTTKEDLTAKVVLNGNTIRAIQNADTVLKAGVDYTVAEDGTITFSGGYLETLAAAEEPYTLTISYHPLGKEYVTDEEEGEDRNEAPANTTIALQVNKAEGKVEFASDISKVYDAAAVQTPIFTTSNTVAEDQSNVTISYKLADATDDTYTEERPVDAGEYTVRVTVSADDDYLEAVGTQDFVIEPKQIKASVKVENKVYDGTSDAIGTASVDTGIEGETLTIKKVAASFPDANAGTKKAVRINSSETVVTAADENTKVGNYDIYYPSRVYADISARTLSGIAWGEDQLIYNNKEQIPTATAQGLLDGDACDIEVQGAMTDTNVKTGEDSYLAVAVKTTNSNYALPADGLTKAFTIEPKPVAISWGSNEFVYNEQKQIPDAVASGILEDTDCRLQVEGAQVDANTAEIPEYVATASLVGEDAANYELKAEEEQISFTIANAEQDAPELTAVPETIMAKEDGNIEGLSTAMEYREKGTEETFTAVTDAKMTFAAGTYEVRMAAKKNYHASAVTEVTIEPGRKLVVRIPEEQTGYELTSDVDQVVWNGSANLTLTVADGYSKLAAFAVKAVDKEGKSSGVLTANEDGTFTISQITSDTEIVVEGIADVTAPTGEISVETNQWDSLLNTITFGKFFKESKEVSITAKDEGTKVKSVAYYLADTALTEEEVQSLTADDWTAYADRFKISPDRKVVVYARLEDYAGNIRCISSDGMVFDAIKPVITGVSDGDELYIEKKYQVGITEENLDKVYVMDGSGEYTEDDVVAVSDGTFVLACEEETEKTILAIDKAGNQESIQVHFVSLTKMKDTAKQEIAAKTSEALAELEKLTDLTKEEKAEAQKNIEQKQKEAEEIIDRAEDRNTVLNPQKEFEETLASEIAEDKKTDFTHAKETAVEEIEAKAEKAKAAIDQMEDLTEEEKAAEKEKIEAKAKEAKAAIDQITDPEQKTEVAAKKTEADQSIEKDTEEAKQTDLARAKETAAKEIEAKAAEAKKAIDQLKNLTEAEKTAAKAEIDKQAEQSKKTLENATSREDVKTTESSSNTSLTEKITETKVNDYNKTKDSKATGEVTIVLKGDTSKPDETYHVGLKVGGTEVEKVDQVKAGENVKFDKLPDGAYNLVVSDGENQRTAMVIVSNGKATTIGDASISAKNTTVEVKTVAPNVAVGGLDKVYETDVFTGNEKAVKAIQSGTGKVDVKLIVDAAQEDNDIKKQINTTKTYGEFVDFQVEMTVTDASATSETFHIKDTKELVLLAKPLTDAEKNRSGYEVLRKHNDGKTEQVETLPALTGNEKVSPSKEGFYVENGYLYIWAHKFSTYVLAYDKVTKVPQTVTPTPTPTQKPTSTKTTTPTVTYVSKKQMEKNGLALAAKLKVSQTGSQINVGWGKVNGATGYDVYVQYCGMKFTAKSITEVTNGNTTSLVVKKVNGKKLNLKKNYKIYVVAYKLKQNKKTVLGKTITAHIVGRKNYKSTNVKNIKLKKSKYTLKVGKKAQVKAKTVLVDKTKKPLSNAHAKTLRYASSNKKVATVSATGKIKAVKKGNCIIYVYARNGYTKKIKVTVK